MSVLGDIVRMAKLHNFIVYSGVVLCYVEVNTVLKSERDFSMTSACYWRQSSRPACVRAVCKSKVSRSGAVTSNSIGYSISRCIVDGLSCCCCIL